MNFVNKSFFLAIIMFFKRLVYGIFMLLALLASFLIYTTSIRFLDENVSVFFKDINDYAFTSKAGYTCTSTMFELSGYLIVFICVWIPVYLLAVKFIKSNFTAHVMAAISYIGVYGGLLLYFHGAWRDEEKVFYYKTMRGSRWLELGWPNWEAVVFSSALFGIIMSLATFGVFKLFNIKSRKKRG